jgi:hypothetical protein
VTFVNSAANEVTRVEENGTADVETPGAITAGKSAVTADVPRASVFVAAVYVPEEYTMHMRRLAPESEDPPAVIDTGRYHPLIRAVLVAK